MLKTPLLYELQLEASIQIEIGPVVAKELLMLSIPLSMVHGLPEFKNFLAVGVALQAPPLAV